MSEPSSSATYPAASDAAEPPEDPPGLRAEIPGVVGDAVDRVVGLPVTEKVRHVGLADDDGAGALQPAHQHRVLRGAPVARRRRSPGGRQSHDVVGFLHRHRHAQKRLALAARERVIGLSRGGAGALEIAHDHCVDLAVVVGNARNGLFEQLGGGNRPCPQCGDLVAQRGVSLRHSLSRSCRARRAAFMLCGRLRRLAFDRLYLKRGRQKRRLRGRRRRAPTWDAPRIPETGPRPRASCVRRDRQRIAPGPRRVRATRRTPNVGP